MQPTELSSYLRRAVRTLPDATGTAAQLSAVMSLVQTAQAALRDGQPDSTCRVDAALTVAVGALALMSKQLESRADYLARL